MQGLKGFVRDYNCFFLCLAMMIAGAFLPNFFTVMNFTNILVDCSIVGFFAIGMSCLLIIGCFDMSLGMQVTVGTLIMALTVNKIGMLAACLLTILGCLLIGLLNGLLVSYFGINAFIVTFGMQGILTGVALIMCNGSSIYIGNAALENFFNYKFLGLPVCIFCFALFAILVQFLLRHTRHGFYLYVLGGNAEAANLSGVSVKGVTITAFLFASLCAALGAILLVARVNSSNATIGADYTLAVITASVVGGIKFTGGYGTVVNTLLGVLAMQLVNNMMYLTNTYGYYITLINGLILLVVLAIELASNQVKSKLVIR